MTPRERRQLAALVILLAGAAVAFVYRPGGNAPAETAQRPSNAAGPGGAETPAVPVVDLHLDRLHGERPALPESTRDPFRFRPAPPPPAPPRTAVTRPQPRPEDFAPAPPAGPPPPPPIAVKFFGLVLLRGERVAAFSDMRGNTFYGKEGDIIEGRYRVLRIGTDSAELAYLDGRGRQTIRLTGQ